MDRIDPDRLETLDIDPARLASLDSDPETPLVIERLAEYRFEGDFTAALAHVIRTGIKHTPERDIPATIDQAGALIEEGLRHTALPTAVPPQQENDRETAPEPFVISVPVTDGPPYTFGRNVTLGGSDSYYHLIGTADTQRHDIDSFRAAVASIRRLNAIDDTDCWYALRQQEVNASGQGLSSLAAALPVGSQPAAGRPDWAWDRVQTAADIELACWIRFKSLSLLVRGTYHPSDRTIQLTDVVMPPVDTVTGGTDIALAVCEQLLPDVPRLETRITSIENRPHGLVSDRVRLGSAAVIDSAVVSKQALRLADSENDHGREWIDRLAVPNPFGESGNMDPTDVDLPAQLVALLTAPSRYVLHLRQHLRRERFDEVSFQISEITAQEIAGVVNISAVGRSGEPDDGGRG